MPRVLIVEDNAALADNLAEILQGGGVESQVAHTAEEALEIARGERFDGVVTDLRLPGMSGLELLTALRLSGHRVPVILVTAFADERTVDQAEQAGALEVLPKPVDLVRFEELVQELTGPRSRVLLLEDSLDLADNIVEALAQRQVETLLTPTVRAALEQRRLPALAIVDLRLPDGSGLEVVRRLQARDPSIRVLITTGHAGDLTEDETRGLDCIVQPILEKPVSLDVLLERIETARDR